MSPDQAFEIASDLVHKTTAALLNEDFEQFKACFSLPHVIETFDATHRVESVEQFRILFSEVCAQYRTIGLTDLVRRVVNASVQAPDRIAALHESRVIRHGGVLEPEPHTVFSELRKSEDGEWRIAVSKYALPTNSPLNTVLSRRRSS